MLILKGQTALSDFRKKRIESEIRTRLPSFSQLSATFVYFVQLNDGAQLSKEESRTLNDLLSLDIALDPSKDDESHHKLLLVLPRPGTISPWSSKATDIVHLSNISAVRRVERGIAFSLAKDISKSEEPEFSDSELSLFLDIIHDRMTQKVFTDYPSESTIFKSGSPAPLRTIDIMNSPNPKAALMKANEDFGLALADDEIDYLVQMYTSSHPESLKRNPTDVELMMFAQVNSEHCRHKVFRASWNIDGEEKDHSLFGMIRNTYEKHPERILSAYSDNAAVLEGPMAGRFAPNPLKGNEYLVTEENIHMVTKVETHNHPTAVSPFPGAATGAGGEIRDEGAVGRGSRPKAGLTGFSVSNLHIPGRTQPWEKDFGKPKHTASSLEIMLQAPLGGAAYNNEFGRPNICGYFRTYCDTVSTEAADQMEIRGYHKPIMIAGGLGTVRPMHVHKRKIPPNSKLIVLGGPSMLIGLGGGAASSMASGTSSADLDFASVQRENPEMERRCQQVIDSCTALGDANPIESIHDVGAGGLSNALPEIVHDSDLGAVINLRDILNDDQSMSPMEIWCNESQERYVLAIEPANLDRFRLICQRERCPFAVVGTATEEKRLKVVDPLFNNSPIDLPMSILFGKPPKMHRVTQSRHSLRTPLSKPIEEPTKLLSDAVKRVLQLPTVASKSFLITIGDRTVTGLVTRDQMVGPWQVPVADVAVTSTSYDTFAGEAMAMGERPVLALLSHAASARMAVAESITNIAAAAIRDISHIRLSANWMSSVDYVGEGSGIYEAVKAIGMELCPLLEITIPVGKDSMSMKSKWTDDNGDDKSVVSPLSLNITAYSHVADVRKTLTPDLKLPQDGQTTVLVFIDLAMGMKRLGGSALAQVYNQLGNDCPDVVSVPLLKAWFNGLQKRSVRDLVLAYHDRSDGGLLTTIVEMSIAGRLGVKIDVSTMTPSIDEIMPALFNEELGVVVQLRKRDYPSFLSELSAAGFPKQYANVIGTVATSREDRFISFKHFDTLLYTSHRVHLQRLWSSTSYHMQSVRDNPACARSEYDTILDVTDPGLHSHLTFDISSLHDPLVNLVKNPSYRPKVAILREQGVNGQTEMAWSFHASGFTSVDVHMTDILSGRVSLDDFVGLAACGGFSYGDVLGAGRGWAKSILCNRVAREQFKRFWERKDTFTLGVCNGCQMVSQVRELLGEDSGAKNWPYFLRNESEQFEARVCMVEVTQSPSVFFTSMVGTRLPIAVAHGEGRTSYDSSSNLSNLVGESLVSLRYVDNYGSPTTTYPYNPNGSQMGITGVTTTDGRVTIMMPHPERVTRWVANSWIDRSWCTGGAEEKIEGPWLKMFQSARSWVG
ncbi:CobB/CobQ-like glutamine amidotransferase domain-containing protein [Paraphysoderma sedebokerense]|nr:CobB/CobQ-like glutamine amidotransferase domain-containing protein [Paraphysoderma sedebokerense]